MLRYDLKEGASKMRILRTMWRYVVSPITRGWLPLSAPIALAGEGFAAPVTVHPEQRGLGRQSGKHDL